MRTEFEIREEKRKLLKWLDYFKAGKKEAILMQIEMIDWILDDDAILGDSE